MLEYFAVPDTRGLAPYRTGQIVHVIFSLWVGAAVWLLAGAHFGAQNGVAAASALLAILLGWGIGTALGVASHGSRMRILAAFGALLALLVTYPPEQSEGIGVAVASHGLLTLLLGWRSRRLDSRASM